MGKNKRNILIKISYDGTNYNGFQIQPDCDTIEQRVVAAIKKITNEEIEKIEYSARTDAGVHCEENYVNFHTFSSIPIEKFVFALNAFLPYDIRVLKALEVDENFNSRYEIIERTYRYNIFTGLIISPFKYKYYLHYPYKIDINKLNEAKNYLIGKHDFKAFCASDSSAKNTIREIKSIEIKEEKEEIKIYITGNAFLKQMIRIIIGTFLEINENKKRVNDLKEIIEKKDRNLAGRTESAKGLCLIKCKFKNEEINRYFEEQ